MTTPTGQINMSDVSSELGWAWNNNTDLNNQTVRNLSGNGSGSGGYIDMNQLRGKSAYTPTTLLNYVDCGGGFGGADYIQGYSADYGYGSLSNYYYRGAFIRGIYETGGQTWVLMDGQRSQPFFNRVLIDGYAYYYNQIYAIYYSGGVTSWRWDVGRGLLYPGHVSSAFFYEA